MSNTLRDKYIQDTYGRVVQVLPSVSGENEQRITTPELYDGYGNKITGIKMQEAFERDNNGDLQPTVGPFFDWFWEEDDNGNKMPRDIKFWLDSNFNLIAVPSK